ncbi:MAG: LysR family transcriptional regulator [Solirubrobacteraceae bacterium]
MAALASDADPLPGGELAAFSAAVESGSVQGAADALQLTQSAATKRIQNLERRIGDQLLERGRFGVRPTALGRTVYPLAKRALDALADVAQAAELSAGQSAKQLRLSASLTIGEFLLPSWLARFRLHHHAIRPQLEVVNSSAVIVALRERRAEIGFVEGLEPVTDWEAMPIARDQLLVVVSTDHPWARRRSLRPAELASQPYLTRERSSGTRAVADAALARLGVTLTPALEAASLQSLKRAIREGGFTLISELTIEAEQRAGVLTGLPVRGVDLHRDLQAIRRRRPRPSGAAGSFWNWLVRETSRQAEGS